MTKDEEKEFKKELKALLLKYQVQIGLDSDASSDWHGITGEKMVASPNSGFNKDIVLSWGNWLGASDIEE